MHYTIFQKGVLSPFANQAYSKFVTQHLNISPLKHISTRYRLFILLEEWCPEKDPLGFIMMTLECIVA